MVYYFHLEDSEARETAFMNGELAQPITLYPETPEILAELEEDVCQFCDWWAVWKPGTFSTEPGDFATIEEAYESYYQNEGESLYCRIHDC